MVAFYWSISLGGPRHSSTQEEQIISPLRIRPIGCIRVKITCKRRATGGLIFRYTCFPFFFLGSRPIFNKYTITYTLSSSYFYLFFYYYFFLFSLSDLKPILLDFCIFPTTSIWVQLLKAELCRIGPTMAMLNLLQTHLHLTQ